VEKVQEVDVKTRVKLSNGEFIDADLYIPSMGIIPNTKCVPRNLLDDSGFVRTNKETLRVDGAGSCVYAIGDYANYGSRGIPDIYAAAQIVGSNLARDLGNDREKPMTGGDALFRQEVKKTQMIVAGMPVPAFMVWYIKSRGYLMNTMPTIVDGSRWGKADKSWLREQLSYILP